MKGKVSAGLPKQGAATIIVVRRKVLLFSLKNRPKGTRKIVVRVIGNGKGLGISQQGFAKQKTEVGPHFLSLLNSDQAAIGCSFAVLAPCSTQRKGRERNGMERKRKTEHNDLLPKNGNPLHETVCYKIGGTVFEIETSCSGSELLYDKMARLIKTETVKTPAGQEK